MGIKSTYDIERETAIDIIRAKLDDCKNEELSEMLEGLKESTYRNYRVYDKFPEEENPERRIETLYDFE